MGVSETFTRSDSLANLLYRLVGGLFIHFLGELLVFIRKTAMVSWTWLLLIAGTPRLANGKKTSSPTTFPTYAPNNNPKLGFVFVSGDDTDHHVGTWFAPSSLRYSHF